MLKKVSEFIKSLQQKQKRTLVGITAALIAIAIVTAVETPSFVSASSNTSRQLPIYSVERDQKMVSLSFDAAWGNDFCGNAREALKFKGLREIAIPECCENCSKCFTSKRE